MSTFPQRLDNLQLLMTAQPNAPSTNDFAETQVPLETILSLESSAIAIEKHVAFSLLTGTDTRVDGTTVGVAANRQFITLPGTWIVTAAQAGTYGCLIPLSSALNESQISLVNTTQAADLTGNTTPGSPVSLVLNPVSILAQRRGSHTWLAASIVVSPTNQAYASLCFPVADTVLQEGESLDILLLLYGGT